MPSSARSLAMAAPIPALAPVTTATLPLQRSIIIKLLNKLHSHTNANGLKFSAYIASKNGNNYGLHRSNHINYRH